MPEQPLDPRFNALIDAWDGPATEVSSLDDPDHEALFAHWVATAQQRHADGRVDDALVYLEAAEREAGEGGAAKAADRVRELAEAVRAENAPLELEEAVPCP
jgi:hypothetical protein